MATVTCMFHIEGCIQQTTRGFRYLFKFKLSKSFCVSSDYKPYQFITHLSEHKCKYLHKLILRNALRTHKVKSIAGSFYSYPIASRFFSFVLNMSLIQIMDADPLGTCCSIKSFTKYLHESIPFMSERCMST